MKFQAAIFCVLVLSAFGKSLGSGCGDEEDHQIYKVLKNANCKLSPKIEKIKSGMGSIRDRFWGNAEGVKGEFDFDEIDVSEEIITMRAKREENEDEQGNFKFLKSVQK